MGAPFVVGLMCKLAAAVEHALAVFPDFYPTGCTAERPSAQDRERGLERACGVRDAVTSMMNGKNKTLFVVVLSLGCSVANEPAEQQRGLEGTGIAAPPEDPEPEDPGEGPSCQPTTPDVIGAWATHRNGHYAFQAPTSLLLDELIGEAAAEVTSFEGNTDPAVSKYAAETIVSYARGATGLSVRVSELAAPGSPSDRIAELAAQPQGLPPPGREHNHECGIVESSATTYACFPAVEATRGCNTIRGYSYQWTRFVYTTARVFEMTCTATPLVDNGDITCAKALDSLVIRE